MALSKDIEVNSTGVFAKYWKISRTTFDYAGGLIVMDLSGYLTKEDRQAGKQAVHTKTIALPITAHAEIRDALYNFLESTETITINDESMPNEFYGAGEI